MLSLPIGSKAVQPWTFLPPIDDLVDLPSIAAFDAPVVTDPQRLEHIIKDGQKWDTRRSGTQNLSEALWSGDHRHRVAAAKVESCSTVLVFAKYLELATKAQKWRLKHTWFCKNRLCPQCAHMKAVKQLAKFKAALPAIKEHSPNGAFLMLTLTVPNCDVSELGATVKRMQKAFHQMMKNKLLMGMRTKGPVLGYAKALEVTQQASNPQNAHPHFHILLHVRPSYFSKDYINQDTWLALWQRYYADASITQVNIKRARDKKGYGSDALAGAFETFKYGIKPADVGTDHQWTRTVYDQLRQVRMLDFGGTIKKEMANITAEREMQQGLEEIGQQTLFAWQADARHYLRQRVH